MCAGYQICRHSVSSRHLSLPDDMMQPSSLLYLSLCKSVVLRSITKLINQPDIRVEGSCYVSA
jgi:hypothetical protein